MIVYAVMSQMLVGPKKGQRQIKYFFKNSLEAIERVKELNEKRQRTIFKDSMIYLLETFSATVDQHNTIYALVKGSSFIVANELISVRMGFVLAHETANVYNAAIDRKGPRMIDTDRYYVKMFGIV